MTIESVHQEFFDELTQTPIVVAFTGVADWFVISDSECPEFSLVIFGETISTDIHCQLADVFFPIVQTLFLIGWLFAGFRIIASA